MGFEPGQIVTVFRSRLRPDAEADYREQAAQMDALARTMPGLVEAKTFTADDGERLTLVTFADEETRAAWRAQADHRAAQAAGRGRYYARYSLQVCRTLRVATFGPPRQILDRYQVSGTIHP